MAKDNTNLRVYLNWQVARCDRNIKTLEESSDRKFFRGQKFAYEKVLSLLDDEEKLFKIMSVNRLEFNKE